MAASRVSMALIAVIALISALAVPTVHCQPLAPAPSPTSDGTAIDQGIAYTLMALALVLTYLIHTLDISPPTFLS